nr:cation:dicarboxylase symporter family transporter [Arboricoccus pini]
MSASQAPAALPEKRKQPFYYRAPFQIMAGIVIGILLGFLAPQTAVAMKVLGDIFLRLIKTVVTPLVFFNLVLGIVSAGDLSKVGKLGLRALIYFEVVSSIALLVSLIVAHYSGVGLDLQGHVSNDASAGAAYAQNTHLSISDFLLHIFPDNFLGAFTGGSLLPVIVIAIAFGAAVMGLPKDRREAVEGALNLLSDCFFKFTDIVMKFAPLGAFGAIAYAIGSNGMTAILSLGYLLIVLYLMLAFVIIVVMGTICWLYGFNLFVFLRYIKAEIFLLFATGSSESAFPSLMEKLQRLGCSKQSVGVVLPTGYAFNLDGTSVYMSLCTMFLANAYGVHLGWSEMLGLVGLMLVTSKGAATVSGGTFIVFAATVTAAGILPVAGLPLLFGINRLTSQAVSICNAVGNAVATLVVAKASGEFDRDAMRDEYARAFARDA